MTSLGTLWLLLLFGYALSVLIEVPILLMGLTSSNRLSETIVNGLLLTALTYPVVIMVLPATFTAIGLNGRGLFLLVEGTFAPIAEMLFFRYLTSKPLLSRLDRDSFVIVFAKLASFLLGEAGLSHWLAAMVQYL